MTRECVVCGDTYKSRISSYTGERFGEILCNKHLLQIKRNGKIIDPTKSRRRDERICDICQDSEYVIQYGREGKFKGFLLCTKHVHQVDMHGEITDPTISQKYKERICGFCNSKEKIIYYPEGRVMLCQRHYSQIKKYGKILPRTVKDKNEIIIKNDYAEVVMYNSKHEETGRALIDIEFIEKIIEYKWRLDSWGYATSKIDSTSVSMQEYIFGQVKKGEIIDHIDKNPLNNRMGNLRVSNKSTNGMNAKLKTNNKSGVSGVCYHKKTNLWRAYINYEYKRVELGYFKYFEDAVKARLEAEVKYHGEFASQKHLFKEYGIDLSINRNGGH